MSSIMADSTGQDGANTSSTTTDNTSCDRQFQNGLLGNDDEVEKHLNSECISRKIHIVYCVYRVLLCGYCWLVLGWWLFSDVNLNHYKVAYVTTFTYITLCLYLLLTSLALIPCQSRPLHWMYQVIWWLSANISLIFGILVTSVALLFNIDGEDQWNFLNLNVHMFNTVIMVIDTVISNRPMKMFGFLPPILYGLAYVIYNVIYTFAGDLEIPIYSFLDWKTDFAKAIGIAFGLLFALIVIHFAIYGLFRCIISGVQGPTDTIPLVNRDVESTEPSIRYSS